MLSLCKLQAPVPRWLVYGSTVNPLLLFRPTAIISVLPLTISLTLTTTVWFSAASRTTTHAYTNEGDSISVQVEPGTSNSRRLYAGIDVAAPWTAVWDALTDYEGLGNFIPGLAQNECLGRATTGCRLLQVGEQSLALGVKFRARVVLNILEHLSGIPSHLVDDQGVDRGLFPGPRSPCEQAEFHDISFALHEGDFQAFQGIWRMQDSSLPGSTLPTTRLSYALHVRPQRWMPIALIQTRIQGEVRANLTAVRNHSQLQTSRLEL